MGREVGIYPEIKEPEWHHRHGVDLAARLLSELAAFGYSEWVNPVFVQCFDAAELVRVKERLGCRMKLVQLVGADSSYAELLTPAGLGRVADYAVGLGPHHAQLVAGDSGSPKLLPLIEQARDCGLQLHPYTFRADDLPSYARTLEEWLEIFFERGRVGGVFCDHPDVAVRVRAAARKVQ
jgi:glycerophosphoryl diester phosphodiesterase